MGNQEKHEKRLGDQIDQTLVDARQVHQTPTVGICEAKGACWVGIGNLLLNVTVWLVNDGRIHIASPLFYRVPGRREEKEIVILESR